MDQPILQFGTSRFLQAHVDLFASEALASGAAGQALGGITVVQTTDNPASAQRVAALASGDGYPVRLRGLLHGERVDTTVTCRAVREALQANADWPRLLALMAGGVQVIVSNTADRGYQLDAQDGAGLIDHADEVPRSFPAKLLVLLHHRWRCVPEAPLSLFPCELIERNGDTLRDLVASLARQWALPEDFIAWLRGHCVWANSLVDRIVSDALHPVGAVAEPYALWQDEIVPVFEALGQRSEALAYLVALRERLLNPYLAHRLADIAQNHAQKKQRRFGPVLALAGELGLDLAQPRLRAALASQD